MLRNALISLVIVLILGVCSVQAAQINSSWVGGASGDWETASNWNPAIVPENGADTFAVTINAGAGQIGVHLHSNHTISTLSCDGNVELQGVEHLPAKLSLVSASGLTNNGELEITAWAVELFKIDGNLTNTNGGTLDFWGARITGDLVNPTGGSVEVNGNVKVNNFENAGSVIVATDHGFDVEQSLQNVSQIAIYGGGCGAGEVFDNNNTGVIKGFGVVYGGERLINKGSIYANGGSLSLITGTNGVLINEGTIKNAAMTSVNVIHYGLGTPSDVNNSGIIEVNAGGGTAFDCNLVNKPAAVIKLYGGILAAKTITQTADANFAGFGGITGNVVIEPNGLIKLTGPTNIVGNVTIQTDATLEISDGTTLVTGHTTNNGTIHMKGGRIIPQGGITNNGQIIWEPGTYNNIVDFNLDGQVNFKDFADFADTWLWQAGL